MKYLKLFEAKDKDWESLTKEIDNDIQHVVKLNDVDVDVLKDISAGLLDIFSGSEITFNSFILVNDSDGEQSDYCFDYNKEDYSKYSYKEAQSVYKSLFEDDPVFLYSININFMSDSLDHNLNLPDDMKKQLDIEIKEIKSHCSGLGFEFTLDQDVWGKRININLEFRKDIDVESYLKRNPKRLVPVKIMDNFDKFIKTYNIPEEGEGDLIKMFDKIKRK